MDKKIIFVIVGIVILSIIFIIGAKSSGLFILSNTDPIKIGVIVPLTGDMATYGISAKAALELAADNLNNKINNRPIKFIIEDGQCSAMQGSAAFNKLINVDKVNFIIGGICSSETLVGKDLIESSETLTISPCASSPDLKNIKNYIFSLYPLDNLDGKLSAEYIYNVLSKRKAAIFSCQSDWCLGEETIFKERFSELGGTITIIEHNTTDESDLRSYLIKINNGDAEIIFAPQYVGGQEKLFEQAKEINLKQTIFVPSLLDKDLVAKLGSISDNIYGTVLKTSETNTLFSDELKQRTGMIKIDSDLCGNRAYDSLMLLNEAIINTKNIDTNKIIDYLHDIDYLGLSGKIQFDKEGMILNGNFVIVKTKNGKLIEQK